MIIIIYIYFLIGFIFTLFAAYCGELFTSKPLEETYCYKVVDIECIKRDFNSSNSRKILMILTFVLIFVAYPILLFKYFNDKEDR